MKTFAVAAYGRNAGSSRVRLFDWLDHLDLNAEERIFTRSSNLSMGTLVREPVSVGKKIVRSRRLISEASGNRVILSRRFTPFSNGGIEKALLRSANFGVYDFDDSLATAPVVGTQRIWSVARTWRESVCAADRVIVGNDYLADQAEGLASDVVVIPSCVRTDEYNTKTSYDISTPVAVWIGSPSTEHYLEAVANPLLRLHSEIGLRLRVISSGTRSLSRLDRMTDRVEWGRESFAQDLVEGDFGIMPLPDDEWTRGKCAYKLLQYGACGLPVIGSPVGANRGVLERCGGLAPESPEDWYVLIKEVLEMAVSRRRALGEAAHRTIQKFYSFDAWEDRWKLAVGLA